MNATQTENAPGRWHRQPVIWLAAAVFAASLAGCIGVILIAAQYSDEPLPIEGERVLKIPAEREPTHSPSLAPDPSS